MSRLEDFTPGASVRGLLPDRLVTVVHADWHGTEAITLTYREDSGAVGNQLLYRDDEARLLLDAAGVAFAFDGDGTFFRLASEAMRIRLAYLFDPMLAVNTSTLDPLPHQIQAVYQEMLPRQPLRFLLADDPGAGKTIMSGLFIKELIIRGDVRRCLIVSPGSLVEQWQDELAVRFSLPFEIITREAIENSRSGNPYAEKDLVISRLDHMARNDDLLARRDQYPSAKLVKEAVEAVRRGAAVATQRYRDNYVTQEPEFTGVFTAQVEAALTGLETAGVRWRAWILTSAGRGALETTYGADCVGLLEYDLPEYHVRKGFLAQAKRLEPGRALTPSEHERLVDQCQAMLATSASSYVILYSRRGIEVVPATNVVFSKDRHLHHLHRRPVHQFYGLHFTSWVGDPRLTRVSREDLAGLRVAGARTALIIRAERVEQGT